MMQAGALAAVGFLAVVAAVVVVSLALEDESAPKPEAAAEEERYSVHATVDKVANCADCHYGISVPFDMEAKRVGDSVEVRVANRYANMTLRALRADVDPSMAPASEPPPSFPVIDPTESSPATPFTGPRALETPLDRVKGWKESWAGTLAPDQSATHEWTADAPGHLLIHLDGASPDNEGEELELAVQGPEGQSRPVLDQRGDLRQAVLANATEGTWRLTATRTDGTRPLLDYILSVTWYPADLGFTDVLATGDERVWRFPTPNGTLPTVVVGVEPFHDHFPFEQPEPYDETNYTLLLRPAAYEDPPAPAPSAPPPEEVLTKWSRGLSLAYVPTGQGDVGVSRANPLDPTSLQPSANTKGGAKFAWYLAPDKPVREGVDALIVELRWQETPAFPGFGLRHSTPVYMHFLVPEPVEETSSGATYRIAVRDGWHDPPGAKHWNWDFAFFVKETLNEPVVYEGPVEMTIRALAPGSLGQ